MTAYIWTLLFIHAPMYGIEPKLAAAIIKTESSFNPKAIGALKEVGLFQIRPEFSRFNKQQLLDPQTNIVAGLEMLKYLEQRCPHKKKNTYVICMNLGIKGAAKIKYAEGQTYYKKVYAAYLAYNRM
jgi:hypothetical protein